MHTPVELLVTVGALVLPGGERGVSVSEATEDCDGGDDDGQFHEFRCYCGLWFVEC